MPILPFNINELNLSLHFLDIAYMIHKNEQPSAEILENKQKGYF
jgi:hypothetical protein